MTEKLGEKAEFENAVSALRTEVKKNATLTAESKETLEKIHADLDKQEVKNQALLLEQKASENRERELKERFDSLEADVARSAGESRKKGDFRNGAEYKAIKMFMQQGEGVDAETKALLRTDIDTAGGYTVVPEMDSEMLKNITEISSIRQIARVRSIGTKTLQMAKRTGIPTATYEGEAEETPESASTYGAEALTVHALTASIPVTRDLLLNSAFNMESDIMSDATEAFAFKEGNKFVLGTGVKQPQGFVTDAAVIAGSSVVTAASGVLDMASIIKITGELKTGYNPVYTMNRKTIAEIRQFTSTTGDFLWQPGVNGVVASTINGFNYVETPDMPDIAGSAYPIAFGDFFKGYRIVDRTGMEVVRDEFTNAKKRIIEFTFFRYNTGGVVLPEAIQLLQIKA